MISKKEKRLRAEALWRFETWLGVAAGKTVEEAARASPQLLSELLEEYLYQLFETRWSRGEARQALLATGDAHGWIRSSLSGAWRILRHWERLEPDKARAPCPILWLRALTVAAATWSWPRVALTLLLGFFGLLRPSEICGLMRSDVLLPLDHGMGGFLMLRIREPKSRWASSRQQYVRVGKEAPVAWLVQELGLIPLSSQIWPGSPATFSKRLAVLSRATLGRADLVLPSGLRTGGATFVFQNSYEDLVRVQWRGRWKDSRMLAIYIQELSAAMVQMRLQQAEAARVSELAALFDVVFA